MDVITPKDCSTDVKKAIQQLKTAIKYDKDKTFSEITITDLTASRLIASDSNKKLVSSDFVNWVTGTANEIDITDDGDGTVTIGIVNPLIVNKGGTGVATLTDGGLLLGSGTGAITPLAQATNGQLPIGSTGADPVLAGITGTANQITVANAAGSITLSTPSGFVKDLVTKTGAYTLTSSDYTILCNAAGGAFTITLPAAASHTGRIYHIKKIDLSANVITVDGNSSETIDDSTTAILTVQYESITIQSDGSEWWII